MGPKVVRFSGVLRFRDGCSRLPSSPGGAEYVVCKQSSSLTPLGQQLLQPPRLLRIRYIHVETSGHRPTKFDAGDRLRALLVCRYLSPLMAYISHASERSARACATTGVCASEFAMGG